MKFYHGLTSEEITLSREKYGGNQLTQHQGESFFDKLKENLNDPLVKILLIALLFNLVFYFLGKSEWYEAVGISIAVILATLISTISEFNNEQSFKKLQEEIGRASWRERV